MATIVANALNELPRIHGTKYELAQNSLLAEYSIRYGGYGGIAGDTFHRELGTRRL